VSLLKDITFLKLVSAALANMVELNLMVFNGSNMWVND